MSIKLPFFLFFVALFFGTTFQAFLAPITKDFSTKKYTLSVYLKTPPQPAKLLLDLGASFSLLNCSSNYTSSTYHPIPCSSSACSSLKSDSCKVCSGGEAGVDSLYMNTTDGRNPGQLGSIPGFMFSCGKRSSLKGLVKGATGVAGFGRSSLSIPAQVSNISSQESTFALCLSGSPSAPGVAFFGLGAPYYFYPEIDLSKFLNYTPLLSSPVGPTTNDYFINLTSIRVNGRAIEFDRAILAVNEKGRGGTKLSTVTPYTKLQSTIFKALTEAFVKESAALNLTVTGPVKPFKFCYEADRVLSTRLGPSVPTVDLVLDSGVIWRVFGSNSMVRIYRDDVDVWCLGVLDGGAKPRTSVVIGGHQIEDNLLQFDLESKRLGFSSSVLVHGTMCANFNFTINL